jgi:thiol-disulfide isomerase/thioredoxin
MKKIFIILFLFLSYSQLFYSQNIKIIGHLENGKDNSEVVVSKSISENPEDYIENLERIKIENNQFVLSFKYNNTGYIEIPYGPNTPRIKLICDKDGLVNLYIKRNGLSYTVDFVGQNAEGLKMLNNATLFSFREMSPMLKKVIQNTTNKEDVLLKIDEIKNEEFKKIDSLYSEKKVTASFLSFFKKHAEVSALSISIMSIEDILRIESNLSKIKLSSTKLKDLIKHLYTIYDPFDEKYNHINSVIHSLNIQTKCRLINEGVLTGVKNDLGLWDNGDISNYYSFAPARLQEQLMVSFINENVIKYATFEKFKSVFNKSVYTDFLENKFIQMNATKTIKPFAFATFSKNEKVLNIKETKEFLDIQELLNQNFKNKSVFVDLWASYCEPCFKQFSYSPNLHTFLGNNNIEILYISIDKARDIEKWEKDISRFNLEGNHYFATDKIQISLMKLLNEKEGVYIPRYLLFNSKGKLVLNNAKKPSEGQALYNQILNALK